MFVGLAGLLSILALYAGLIAAPIFKLARPIIPVKWLDSLMFFFIYLFASGVGSSAYWLLVRTFWLKSLRFGDWLRTATLCVIATGLGLFVVVETQGSRSNHSFDPFTVFWWFAFSASLYWSENKEGTTLSRPG